MDNLLHGTVTNPLHLKDLSTDNHHAVLHRHSEKEESGETLMPQVFYIGYSGQVYPNWIFRMTDISGVVYFQVHNNQEIHIVGNSGAIWKFRPSVPELLVYESGAYRKVLTTLTGYLRATADGVMDGKDAVLEADYIARDVIVTNAYIAADAVVSAAFAAADTSLIATHLLLFDHHSQSHDNTDHTTNYAADADLTTHKTSSDHDSRYFTETEVKGLAQIKRIYAKEYKEAAGTSKDRVYGIRWKFPAADTNCELGFIFGRMPAFTGTPSLKIVYSNPNVVDVDISLYISSIAMSEAFSFNILNNHAEVLDDQGDYDPELKSHDLSGIAEDDLVAGYIKKTSNDTLDSFIHCVYIEFTPDV